MKIKGLTQAALIAGYCALIGAFMTNIESLFGKAPNTLGPVVFLTLLSSSVLICGLLVFYKPYLLFFSNKKKEAIDLVLHTAIWLFVFFILFLVFAFVLR